MYISKRDPSFRAFLWYQTGGSGEEERSDLKKFYTRRRVQYLQKSHSLGPFRKLSYPTVDIFMPDYRQKYDKATKDCKPEDGRDEVVEN